MHSSVPSLIPATPRRRATPPDEETTPTPRAGRTTVSRAWLDPEGAEREEIFVPERVTGMGLVKKREMTPVEERTERTTSSVVRVDDEARVLTWSGTTFHFTIEHVLIIERRETASLDAIRQRRLLTHESQQETRDGSHQVFRTRFLPLGRKANSRTRTRRK